MKIKHWHMAAIVCSVFAFTPAQAAIVTANFIGGGAGWSILDNSTLNVNSTVGVSANILDVNVNLSLTHTFDADLDISLTSPTGTSIDLSSDNGSSGNNYTGTVFDDEAVNTIIGAMAPFTGSFSPEVPLSSFDGENMLGLWTLSIHDDAYGDIGSLTSWSLDITYNDVSNVPVPPAIWLFGTALAGLAGSVRRRKFG